MLWAVSRVFKPNVAESRAAKFDFPLRDSAKCNDINAYTHAATADSLRGLISCSISCADAIFDLRSAGAPPLKRCV